MGIDYATNNSGSDNEVKMMSGQENRLKQCTIVLTRGCNLRCDFCFEKEAGYRAHDRLSLDEVKRIVDLCGDANVRYVFLTGGEPLTYPHLLDVLRYIKEEHPSITPTIATNGVLLEDMGFCQRLIDCGLRYLDISMKGADATEWKRATGFDGYAKQLRAISNLASTELEFTCSMVITEENVTRVCEAVQAAHESGARQFSFTFFIDNIKSGVKDLEYLEEHDPFALIELFVSQIDRLNAITDDWWVEYSFPLCAYTERQLELLEGRLAGPCQIHLQNAITVDTTMKLLPCDMYASSNLGRFGNEFCTYRELDSWMDGPEYQSAVEEMRKRPSEKCSSCALLDQCYGGCPVLWKNYSFEALMNYKASVVSD